MKLAWIIFDDEYGGDPTVVFEDPRPHCSGRVVAIVYAELEG